MSLLLHSPPPSLPQVTEKNISDLRAQLEELEQLNYTVSLQIPSKKTVSGQDRGDNEDEEDLIMMMVRMRMSILMWMFKMTRDVA